MRTCDYSDVLRATAALAGIPVATLSAQDFALFRTFHDTRLQTAWEAEKWPDVCPVEQRTFREPWNLAKTYAATNEVYDPPTNAYYQSLIAGNLNHPPSTNGVVDNTRWYLSQSSYGGADFIPLSVYAVGVITRNPLDNLFYACNVPGPAGSTLNGGTAQFAVLTPFVRNIDYMQTWPPLHSGLPATTPANPIGEFLQTTDKNPETTTRLHYFTPTLRPNGAVYVTPHVQCGFVWLVYRLRRPELTGDAFDASLVYASGLQMYYTDPTSQIGNFYTAAATTTAGDTPASAPSKWTLVALPYFARRFLIRAGYADWLLSDGQGDKFETANEIADSALEAEMDKLVRQQQQAGRLQMAPA